MVAKLEEKYLRIYCPTHKVSFAAMEAKRIVCAGGGEALAEDFPYEQFWEYCCDCQSFWPSVISKGGKAQEQCTVCERRIKQRFVCEHCKLISLESDDAARRKAFTIERGIIEPVCPGCSHSAAGSVVREHECEEADAEFMTARTSCPFCDEQIAARPSFPSLASEYIEKAGTKKLVCRLEQGNSLLVAAPEGDYLLIASGNGMGPSIVLPRLTRFSTKQDFFNSYKNLYDCDEPAAGEVFIIYPAIADKVEEGWRLRETGRLKINKDEEEAHRVVIASETAVLQPQGYACPNCNTMARAEHAFCKSCGYALKQTEASASTIVWPDQTSAPLHDVVQENGSTIVAPEHSNRRLGVVVALVMCAAIMLSIIAVVKLSGSSSVQSKLESAIARGNLVSPRGDSAYDHYQQLKRDGADKRTLANFDNRLLPMLNSRPQAMIDSWAKPDGKDAAPAEWDEASRMLSWASEIKPADNSLAARASYCKGRLAYLNKRMDEAVNHWKRASDLDRSWALPANDIGYLYLKDKAYALSRDFFNEAMRREKNWAVPYLYAGDSYYVQKYFTDAQWYYEEAARLAPQWARAHAALGDLAKLRGNDYLKQMNTSQAREEYQKAQQELEIALDLVAKNPGTSLNRKGIDDSLRDVRQRLQQLDGS